MIHNSLSLCFIKIYQYFSKLLFYCKQKVFNSEQSLKQVIDILLNNGSYHQKNFEMTKYNTI